MGPQMGPEMGLEIDPEKGRKWGREWEDRNGLKIEQRKKIKVHIMKY